MAVAGEILTGGEGPRSRADLANLGTCWLLGPAGPGQSSVSVLIGKRPRAELQVFFAAVVRYHPFYADIS